ncbi:MAG: PqqD family protein [Bryobacteraceae bacterium]
MMDTPTARNSLLIQAVGDELVLLDRKTNRAHRLNRPAAAVWRQCDGTRTVNEIAHAVSRELAPGDDALGVTEAALGQFADLNLLENGIPRRDAARRMAIAAAALVPLVATIAVPRAARAASGGGSTGGDPCSGPGGCQ